MFSATYSVNYLNYVVFSSLNLFNNYKLLNESGNVSTLVFNSSNSRYNSEYFSNKLASYI